MEAKADTFCSLSISLQPFTLDQLALNLTEFKTPQDFIMEAKVLSVPYHSHCSLSHLIKNKTQNLHLMTAIKSNIVFRWNTIYPACIRQGFYHQN
jgi:hypothetical protein